VMQSGAKLVNYSDYAKKSGRQLRNILCG
jgi:hypothetical protein